MKNVPICGHLKVYYKNGEDDDEDDILRTTNIFKMGKNSKIVKNVKNGLV